MCPPAPNARPKSPRTYADPRTLPKHLTPAILLPRRTVRNDVVDDYTLWGAHRGAMVGPRYWDLENPECRWGDVFVWVHTLPLMEWADIKGRELTSDK